MARPTHVVALDGGGRRRITSGSPAAAERSPAWSPDGLRIAFERNARDGLTAGIYVVGADGRGERRLARGNADDPAWSPDGSRLAFSAGALHVVDADGGARRRLTSPTSTNDRSVADFEPDWSPDGRRIVFLRHESGRGADVTALYVVGAGGGNERPLFDDGTARPRAVSARQ